MSERIGRLDLACPSCGRRESFQDISTRYVSCPDCGPIDLMDWQVPCVCDNDAVTVWLPEGTQPVFREYVEGHLDDTPHWRVVEKGADDPYQESGPGLTFVHTYCHACDTLLAVEHGPGFAGTLLTGAEPSEDPHESPYPHDQGVLQRVVRGSSRWFADRVRTRDRRSWLNIGWVRRGGQMVASVLFGLTLSAFLPTFLATVLGDVEGIDLPALLARGLLFGAITFYSWLTFRDVVAVTGEHERKASGPLGDTRAIVELMLDGRVTAVVWMGVAALLFPYHLLASSVADPAVVRDLVLYTGKVGEALIVAMAFQVYAGLALLLYSRWSEMKFHPRTTGFEDGFLSGLTTIEKYAEIALYNVFFLTIALFSFYALLVGAFPGEWFLVFEPATIRTYYPTAAGLLIVGTLTTYFTMLSRFVSISKSSALDCVRRKIQERDAGDKEELLVEEERIRQSGRWILGIHYGARFLFLTLIVVQGYLANRLFGLLG